VPKPVIIAIDDDPQVLPAVGRDLRQRYGDDYRILTAGSGAEALEIIGELKLRNDEVALLLSDQRMPEMTGVELLEEAVDLYPRAKRALLTAYSDTEVAIRAINTTRLDHYITKPWQPPEERLYPVLDDLLDDWLAGYRPPFEGVRVVGGRWAADVHELKQFLAKNQIPYEFVDTTSDEGRELIGLAKAEPADLPLVVLPDGSRVLKPAMTEGAEKVGLRTRAEGPFYDFVIVGGGPAGLAAAVYGASEGLSTLLVERDAPGGQAAQSSKIENYLGFPSGVSGSDLARRAMTQARRFGADLVLTRHAASLDVNKGSIGLTLDDGTVMQAHSMIIATGVSYRRLQAPGIENLTGSGVYYGSAIIGTDSLHDQHMHIVGGGNSAGQAAVYLAGKCERVTMLIRGPSLASSMSHYLLDRIANTENIDIRFHTTVEEVAGNDHLEQICLRNQGTGETEVARSDGLFIFIGAMPPTAREREP
jgi:thioredoxin reductase (NADPH)